MTRFNVLCNRFPVISGWAGDSERYPDRGVIVKGCVQWNHVYNEKISASAGVGGF